MCIYIMYYVYVYIYISIYPKWGPRVSPLKVAMRHGEGRLPTAASIACAGGCVEGNLARPRRSENVIIYIHTYI